VQVNYYIYADVWARLSGHIFCLHGRFDPFVLTHGAICADAWPNLHGW
jgi:hypothetical protein